MLTQVEPLLTTSKSLGILAKYTNKSEAEHCLSHADVVLCRAKGLFKNLYRKLNLIINLQYF